MRSRLNLVFDMARRAKELADTKTITLRIAASGDGVGPSSANRECLGMSKGDLIEKILIEEFDADTAEVPDTDDDDFSEIING